MDQLIAFFSFADINTRYVVFGSMLLAISTAVVGCFSFLRNRSLSGDAVAHAVLPGICLSFMLTGTKNPIYLLIGAFITGWLSLLASDYLKRKTKLKEDTTIAIVLSVFFGIGIVLLTAIQQSGAASQSGLDKFLFGQAASLVGPDLIVFASLAVLLLLITFLFFKEFTLLSFDKGYAVSLGLPVKFLEILLSSLTVLAIVTGIQAVGVVLMAAMLITPAAGARFWTNSLVKMLWIAATLGAVSGLAGAYISYVGPGLPTGPWIVMVLSGLAILSFFFAPKKGILFLYLNQQKHRRKILTENVLKAFFHAGEAEELHKNPKSEADIQTIRPMKPEELSYALKLLRRSYLVKKSGDSAWQLTDKGFIQAKRVAKLHRLWELYLATYLNLPPDHIHDNAETIEHIITPQVEQWLEQQLNYPKTDPHGETIPY